MSSPPLIFDRPLYVARQAKASGKVTAELDQLLSEELEERLAVVNRSFENLVVIAPRGHELAQALQASGKATNASTIALTTTDNLALLENSCDAIVSLIDLQTVNDVPGYLAQLARALRPDGLAMAAFFAGDTLLELRDAWLNVETEFSGGVTPRIAPMIDLRETGGLLQRAGLALPVADMQRLTLRYANPLALMREVKAAGFSNPLYGRRSTLTSARTIADVAAYYQKHHADADGRIRATVEIAWALAWKPHPSQQQALKPGSAKARLADALKIDQ